MAKKRKLNSTNPKYKVQDKNEVKFERTFIKEVRGVKIYTIKYL